MRYRKLIGALSAVATVSCTEAQPPSSEVSIYDRVLLASPYAIAADTDLDAFVTATAETAIANHCAGCHTGDLTGRPGVPNLVDGEWLWGITFEETNDVGPVMEIEQTILYGVRNKDCPEIAAQSLYGGCADTRYSEMPGYREIGVFDDAQIADLTEYVISLTGASADTQAAERGSASWPICIECHGPEGRGYKPYGGPDLTDEVWLYGADRETVADVIAIGRLGVCPPWGRTLDPATIKSLAVYIWRKANGG